MNALVAENLTKIYKPKILALENVSFKIAKGSCVGYLGPNGAGKTTTLKIFTNLIKPTEGRAFINGINTQEEPKKALKNVGSLIEVPGAYEYLTPNELLTYLGNIYELDSAQLENRIPELLAQVLLLEWRNKKIASFSTGMHRRLAIAIALLHDPEILILDEPALGLDPQGIRDVREIIKCAKAQGKTIFLSSHLLHEVSELCDRVILLDRGKILRYDLIEDLRKLSKVGRIKIEFLKVLGEKEIKLIKNIENIKDFRIENLHGVIDYEGDREESASILEKIISLGVRIVSYQLEEASLEDIYISILGKANETRQ